MNDFGIQPSGLKKQGSSRSPSRMLRKQHAFHESFTDVNELKLESKPTQGAGDDL